MRKSRMYFFRFQWLNRPNRLLSKAIRPVGRCIRQLAVHRHFPTTTVFSYRRSQLAPHECKWFCL